MEESRDGTYLFKETRLNLEPSSSAFFTSQTSESRRPRRKRNDRLPKATKWRCRRWRRGRCIRPQEPLVALVDISTQISRLAAELPVEGVGRGHDPERPRRRRMQVAKDARAVPGSQFPFLDPHPALLHRAGRQPRLRRSVRIRPRPVEPPLLLLPAPRPVPTPCLPRFERRRRLQTIPAGGSGPQSTATA